MQRHRTASRIDGVVVPFPAARAAGRDYNEGTMRPEAVPADKPIGDFRLGDWDVRPRHNRLVSEDEVRHLEPKAMDLLVFMASSEGDVVSKIDIIDAVWEGRLISEGTLTNTVAELRRALGDDARHPRYLETIPKRGYRLVAPVEPLSQSAAAGSQAVSEKLKTLPAVLTAIGILVVALAVAVVIQTRDRPLDPTLVLAGEFVNRTGDVSYDAAAVLIRDRLVNTLSESGLARGLPASAVEPGDAIDLICSDAREVGAALAIGGALYLHEGEVEVQAKLVDVGESAVLFAIPASVADRDRLSEALDEVVQRAVGAIASHLRAHAHFRLMSHAPVFEAYQEFMAGSELFAVDRQASIRHLERAVEFDPKFTSAIFRLAAAYRNFGRQSDSVRLLDRLNARRAALTDFERLWLDYFMTTPDYNRSDRLALLRRIQEFVPDDLVVRHMIGNKTFALNRPRETIAATSAVVDGCVVEGFLVNPIVIPTYLRCATSYHILGEFEDELRIARAGIEIFPASHLLLTAETRALTALGDQEALDAAVDRALSTSTGPKPAGLLIEAAATARAHGRADLSRELASRALTVLDERADPRESQLEGWLRALALVFTDDLDGAQTVLEGLSSAGDTPAAFESYDVAGWLGVVAARRGDLDTARAAEKALEEMGDGHWGWPSHYRAAIAAWLGHRDQALDLLSRSQAEGWGSFYTFHDHNRVLFEPLDGMDDYQALLHPVD